MARLTTLTAAVLFSVLACLPALASPSGLTLIPTADVLPHKHVCIEYQLDGRFPLGSGTEASLLNTQWGARDRAEVGLDLDFSEGAETSAMANAKLLLTPPGATWAVAAGVAGVGDGLAPNSYGVVTLDRGRLRLHAGAQITADETQGFVGTDWALWDRVQLWLEHAGGDGGGSAISLAYEVSSHWAVTFGWIDPNEEEADTGYSIHAGCMWPRG